MFRWLLIFLSFSFINIIANDKKIINIRECNYYRLGDNVDKKEVYDMSLTKDLKIKGIQCTALFHEGY
jgi:hypothetical protein